jgi:hypothetical protein
MLSLCAGSSSAALIFCDNFDSYDYGNNWPGAGGWSILYGSVDMNGEGGFWDVRPGNGNYVDLAGSTNQAGAIITEIPLLAGDYVLQFDLAGSGLIPGTGIPRGGDNTARAMVDGVASAPYTLSYDTPFTTFTLPFTVVASGLVPIAFGDVGPNDNVGLFLDNVQVHSVDGKIPAPGAILLGSIGVGIVGWLRRRRVV